MKEPIVLAEARGELRSAYREALCDEYEVFLAADGHEAVAMLEVLTPAAIVAAMEMPRLDGPELIVAARALPHLARVPVALLVSGDTAGVLAVAGASLVTIIPAGRPDALVVKLSAFLQEIRLRRVAANGH